MVASAVDHRMNGLLWTALSARLIELPREHVRTVARRDLAVQRHHHRLWAAVDAIQERLAAVGIGVAFAKGVAAEARWFDRLGERPSTDIDVLIEPGAVERLTDVIDALEPTYFLRADAPRLVRSGILQSLDLDFEDVDVDVHADIFKIEIPIRQAATIWSRTTVVSGFGDRRVRALDPEISLIHFLLHLNKDRFSRLIGFADVARLLSRERLDWAFIDEFVRREGLRVPVYSSLYVVTSTLGLPAPPVPRPRGPRAGAWDRLWSEDIRLRGNDGLVEHQHRQLLLPLLTERRMVEGVRWLMRRRLFPPRALVPAYYPNTRGPYFVRLAVGRLARRDARETARRLRPPAR